MAVGQASVSRPAGAADGHEPHISTPISTPTLPWMMPVIALTRRRWRSNRAFQLRAHSPRPFPALEQHEDREHRHDPRARQRLKEGWQVDEEGRGFQDDGDRLLTWTTQRARRPTQHTAEGTTPRRPACQGRGLALRRSGGCLREELCEGSRRRLGSVCSARRTRPHCRRAALRGRAGE